MSCPEFWLKNPRILIDEYTEFFPFTEIDKRCTSAALNSFTRFGIYIGVLLAVVRMEPLWLLAGLAFAVIAVIAWTLMSQSGAIREGFGGLDIVDTSQIDDMYVPDIIGEKGRTDTTAANPFMNILMNEFTDNPYRKPAQNIQAPAVRAQLDAYFETMFASDPGDAYQRTQSQRTWVTQPSTTIPNDQGSYQDWLYRSAGQTCKEGNMSACSYTTDAKIPWREF
jgi:hypothetical protein